MPVTCLPVSESSSAEKEKGPREMKSLLFALGLALCCFAQVNQDQRFEDIDHSLMPKHAMVTAVATNCQHMKNMAARMPAFHVSFNQLSQDKLEMTVDMATRDGCQTFKPKITRENGVFTTKCGHGSTKTVEYIRFIRDGVIFTSLNVSDKGGQCSIATVTVPDLAQTQGALDDFRGFANEHNLQNEEIKVLKTEGICPRST